MKIMRLIIIYLICLGGISYAQTVTIGTQVWMTKNLDITTFRNGDTIPEAKTNEEWVKAKDNKKPAWCYYKNDPANGAKYGKLYNWYAVSDPRGLAPVGYHIPSDAEWTILTDYLGEEGVGTKIKNKSGWEKDVDVTNESGFSALPGGRRYSGGTFVYIGQEACWWSSTDYNTISAQYRRLGQIVHRLFSGYSDGKGEGFSVRCLRD